MRAGPCGEVEEWEEKVERVWMKSAEERSAEDLPRLDVGRG
jgi:predicted transglutaminase-like protease